MWASGKDFATQRGVHPSRVSQWKRQGRLVLNTEGRIDVEASHAKLNASLDKAKGERRTGNITSTSASSGAVAPFTNEPITAGGNGKAQDEQGGSPKDDSGYWQSKARREKAEAELAELKALQAAGAVISTAGVKRERTETARKLRNRLLAIPDRIAPVVDPANPARAHKLITDEIQKALRELSTELEERAAAAARSDEPAEALL